MRRAPLLARICCVAVCGALAAACSSTKGGPGGPDGGPDAGPKPHPIPGPGQAAAWRIADDADLVGGPSTAGRKGDFTIANGRVRFVIEGAHASDGYDPHGCSVIAADRQRPAGTAGESRFGEMVLLFDFRGAGCDTLEVVSDGSDEGVAWLRATGRDEEVPYAASLFSEGTEPPRLHATIIRDYVLAPDSDVLQLNLTVRNDGVDALSLKNFYAAMAMNRGLRHWVPGSGFDVDDMNNVNPSAELYAALGDKVSYSLLNLESPYSAFINFAKVLFGRYASVVIPAGQARAWRFYLAVGGGDVGSLQAAHAQARGVIQSGAVKLAGSVVTASGDPIEGARVHVTDTGGTRAASFARTGADGKWSAALAAGTYALRPVADDRPTGAQQPVTLSSQGLDGVRLQLGSSSRIEVSASDAAGPIPVKVVAEPIAYGRTNLPSSLGEKWALQPIVAFAERGQTTLNVFPGEWKVSVSRGFEYDLKTTTVAAPSGGTAQVSARLTRVVDTSGWQSGDFHVHAQNSIDGDDLLSEKVRAFAAEGVEIPVSTEHEFVGDFGPAVRALGLGPFMHPMAGTELTTTFIGHFNVFPMEPDTAKVNAGAFQWYGRLVPQVLAEARARRTAAGAPIVQMNHPRTLGMAYLDAVGFDPFNFTANAKGNAVHFTREWDAMEVWNGQPIEKFDGEGCSIIDGCRPTAADWFAFLDRGIRLTGTGNSDSHSASFEPVGYPRTYVKVGTDDPAALRGAEVVAALRGQAAVISGGPFLLTSAVGLAGTAVFPGGTAVADGSSGTGIVALRIELQAPTWMGPLSRVDVWRGDANARLGAVRALSLDLTQGPYKDPGTSVKRLSTTVAIEAVRDTWLVVTARGSNPEALWPVIQWKVPPFAITNPIWVDADGDGIVKPLRQ